MKNEGCWPDSERLPLSDFRRAPTDSAYILFKRKVVGVMIVAAGEKPWSSCSDAGAEVKKHGPQWAHAKVLEGLVKEVEELRERPRNAWFTYGEGADEVAVTGLASEGAVKGKLDRDKHPTYWIGQAFRTVVARIEREQNARACESLLEARLLAETRLQAFEEQQAKAAEAAHECAELQARLHAAWREREQLQARLHAAGRALEEQRAEAARER